MLQFYVEAITRLFVVSSTDKYSLYDDVIEIHLQRYLSVNHLYLMKYSVIDFLNPAQQDAPNKECRHLLPVTTHYFQPKQANVITTLSVL